MAPPAILREITCRFELLHRQAVLCESAAIIQYLHQHQHQTNLMPLPAEDISWNGPLA